MVITDTGTVERERDYETRLKPLTPITGLDGLRSYRDGLEHRDDYDSESASQHWHKPGTAILVPVTRTGPVPEVGGG